MPELPDFDARWDFGDPAGTEAAFRTMQEEHGPAAGPLWRAEIATQIARTLGLQRKFEEADAVLDEAKPIADTDDRVMARWLLERGRVRNSNGQKEEAMPLFEEAWRKAESVGADYLAVDALHMLAIAAPPEAQLEWHRKAIDRAAASKEPKARNWRASLLNNLAWTLHDAGEHEAALNIFREALEARIEQGKTGPIQIAKWSVARCLRSLGRSEEALSIQLALRDEHESQGSADGYVSEEIGECLLALGRDAEARPHFLKAYQVLSQDAWLVEKEPSRLRRLMQLGSIPQTDS